VEGASGSGSGAGAKGAPNVSNEMASSGATSFRSRFDKEARSGRCCRDMSGLNDGVAARERLRPVDS
jgi:hypothetical protein